MRLDYSEVTPEIGYTMAGLQRIVAAAHLEPELLERVKQRASQINGRAYCLDFRGPVRRVEGTVLAGLGVLYAAVHVVRF